MFNRLISYFQRQRRINRTIKELSEMSNYELSDIGISRSMIRSVATQVENDEYNKSKPTTNANLEGWA